jgi:adenine-specific DNA-methyltransferase
MPLPYIPYRIKHKTYARENRSRPTVTEKIARKSMLSGRPLGYKFTRQKPLWPYIADFYCSKLLLVIEIDGWYHQGTIAYDRKRDAYLKDLGIKTVRYTNVAIVYESNAVYTDLCRIIEQRAKELSSR